MGFVPAGFAEGEATCLETTRTAIERAERVKMAEREGFEPPCRLPDKTLSRRPRYDHFGTSPNVQLYRSPKVRGVCPGKTPESDPGTRLRGCRRRPRSGDSDRAALRRARLRRAHRSWARRH